MGNFDEKSGVIYCNTDWGRWYQTIDEVVLEIDCPQPTRGKEVFIDIKPKHLCCLIKGKLVLEGELCHSVVVDESIWSVEDRKLVRVQLIKSDKTSASCWKWLLRSDLDGQPLYVPDPFTLEEMQKKQTLENYQLKHPGFDFSSAELTGNLANNQQK